MNNVNAVVLRTAGYCLRSPPWPKPSSTLFHASRSLSTRRSLSISVNGSREPARSRPDVLPPIANLQRKHFSSTTKADFHRSSILRVLGPLKPQAEPEKGLAFGEEPLTEQELQYIFDCEIPDIAKANRFLRVLHGRRIDGTLDLPLPEDLVEEVDQIPGAVESGLQWLRDTYEADEEEAVIARIAREESGYEGRTPSQLRQRGLDLGLYGPQISRFDAERKERRDNAEPEYYGPQSGKYQAKLSEKEGDVFGQSQIEKIRVENEAKSKEEEAELEQQIEEIQARRISQAQEERSRAVATRPEQGIETVSEEEVRPPNEFEKWILRAKNRASSKLTLDSPEVRDKSNTARLLPSSVFAALFCTGCWYFSQHWQPPKRADRLWPSMSLSFATIAGIIAVNTTIFVLWRFPPAWGLLNRYFLVVPALPNPISLFGNVFSHVQTRHLLFNMLPLLVFGPSLHEDMGRGNFIALYLASGVIGSFASLTHHTLRGILYTSSLGASGSVWAITAAFFCVHANNDFTVLFMPQEWKDQAYLKGWMLFSCLIAIDIFTGFRGKPVTVDYVAHASGALTGWVLAEWYKWRKAQTQADGQFVPKTKLPWWQVILQEGGNQDKGGS